KYEEALADFNRAIESDEKDAWAMGNRGETYQLMEKYEEALADFNRAIELDEKDAWAMGNRGLTYQLMGKYEEALVDFDRAIGLDPKRTSYQISLAACYRKLGLMDKYNQHLAVVREFISEETNYNRACFAAICDDVEGALLLLQKALEETEEDLKWVRRDPDFDWIRDDPRFIALLDEMAARRQS